MIDLSSFSKIPSVESSMDQRSSFSEGVSVKVHIEQRQTLSMDWYVPGVELAPTCEPQQVDLSKAARRQPLAPSAMHFPVAVHDSPLLSIVTLQLEWLDSASDDSTTQHLTGVVETYQFKP